jgi:hypothetical protein
MLISIHYLGTTVVCVTTGASVSVASTPRLLAGGERLLVCPRRDKLYIYSTNLLALLLCWFISKQP